MTYEVETPVFVGPFDLLLKMVTRRHVDVMEVNISRVIEDYLASIEEKEVNLELASGFVLMAAMLIHLKARFLLPEPRPGRPRGRDGIARPAGTGCWLGCSAS